MAAFNGSIKVNVNNDLNTGSRYEDIETVSRVTSSEWQTSVNYRNYFTESLQNYKRVAGYIYSAADLAKLNLEERPKFVYNLLRPIILQLAGNFINNQSKVDAIPRTPGDFKMSVIMSDLLDYAHYTANQLRRELAIAFVHAIIGRVGWIAQDWSYINDPEGMIDIQSWDPFKVMLELGFTRRNLKDCNYIINRGWYSPEEIRNTYALDKDDLYDEITEKAKLYLGTESERNEKLISYIERTFGPHLNIYPGKEQGYDEVTVFLDGMLYNNGNYFDGNAGLFKVIEFHERRQDKFFTLYDASTGRKYDITKAIGATKDGKKYDSHKLTAVKEAFIRRGGIPYIKKEIINQIYQTSVCPAFNIVLSDEPYEVQNGNFKLTPIFCFDFGTDTMDWKSYVDDLIDPVSAFNLRMNTMQTYLMKTAHAETWAEEGAFGEYEDDWLQNKIGAIKYIKAGKIDKVISKPPPALPTGLLQDSQIQKDLIKEISGVRDNALGTKEQPNESGKLNQIRVQQSNILQEYIQNNAISQLKTIGENTKDYLLHYMEPGRAIRITQDETNPYWVEINQNAIRKLFVDKEGNIDKVEYIQGNFLEGKYDIMISKAPFGEEAKQKEFNELMVLTEVGMKINPAYVKFEYLVKQSRLRTKEEWLQHIKQVDKGSSEQGKMAMAMEQKQLAEAEQEQKLKNMKLQLDISDKAIEVDEKKKEAEAEDFIKESIMGALS